MWFGNSVALGVDWSGGKSAHRKIWAARLACHGDRAELQALFRPFTERLSRPFGNSTIDRIADDFEPWLAGADFDVAGLDFCFGLAAAHMHHLQLPTSGPRNLGQALKLIDGPDIFRLKVGKELRRETDRDRRSPFCPTNLRMYRQTFWGLRALSKIDLPIPPWESGDGAVVEVLPADVARHLDLPSKLSREGRESGVAALDKLGIAIRESDQILIAQDREGDALDAVLAAVAAAAARENGFAGAPESCAMNGEGWIYSL